MSPACTQLIAPSIAFLITSTLVIALLSRAVSDAILSIDPVYGPRSRADIFKRL